MNSILRSKYEVHFFFFKQKTAYEMRISDWSSDVCSSDLILFRIDDRDYRAKLAQAEANVQAARARVANSAEDIALQHILVRHAAAQRRAAAADLMLARKTSNRRQALVDGGAVSQAQVDESDTDRKSTRLNSSH